MERTISKMGFKVYVANPAYMRALTGSVTKNDRGAAHELTTIHLTHVLSSLPLKFHRA